MPASKDNGTPSSESNGTWYYLSVKGPDPSEQIHEAWVADARRAVIADTFDPAHAVFRTFGTGPEGFTIYFSPAARELAVRFGAQPCAKPPSTGIGILVGVELGWELNFPGDTFPTPV